MPLVEVVPHPKTSTTAIESALSFYKKIGQNPVLVKQETPGFVANRLQAALVNEAYSLVSRGIISAEDLGTIVSQYRDPKIICCSADVPTKPTDSAITTSLGPRWAAVGPFMANAMGGGGGLDGFKALLEHLGPASQVWVEDMRRHSFHFTDENIGTLVESVKGELGGKDIQALEAQRDREIIGIFKAKQDKNLDTGAQT